ncbi:hypothetical protein GW782_00100 [bacterium]|nr:hypothetical protein [archaeon]
MSLFAVLGIIDLIGALLLYFAYSNNLFVYIIIIALIGKGLFSLITVSSNT